MALNYKTCKNCGNIFQSTGPDICPGCLRKMEDQFKIIKEYLYQHPKASVEEVAEKTEVEEKLILHFLREGRLEMVAADGSLVCEKCGAPITSGRLCKTCSGTLANALESVLPRQENTAAQKRRSMGSGKPDKLHVDINIRK